MSCTLLTKRQTAVCVSLALTNVLSLLPGSLHSDGWTGFRLRRLYFVWVCRELQSFYWFAELLCAVHHKVRTKAAPLLSASHIHSRRVGTKTNLASAARLFEILLVHLDKLQLDYFFSLLSFF